MALITDTEMLEHVAYCLGVRDGENEYKAAARVVAERDAAEARLAACEALVERWRKQARDNQFHDFRADELEAAIRVDTNDEQAG